MKHVSEAGCTSTTLGLSDESTPQGAEGSSIQWTQHNKFHIYIFYLMMEAQSTSETMRLLQARKQTGTW
jgi:hypothetical protein